jgi:hypothetical protein
MSTLFDHLNNITVNKKELNMLDDEEIKSYSNFMINRFVSMTELYVPLVNEINKHDIPKQIHQKFYLSVLPKRKHYFKYIKKSKDVDNRTKEILSKHFQVGTKDIESMIRIMNEKQISEIVDKYDGIEI